MAYVSRELTDKQEVAFSSLGPGGGGFGLGYGGGEGLLSV